MSANQQKRLFPLTQDLVFKSFFSRNKQVLHSLLKSFLPLSDDISNITIINPEPRDKQAQEKVSQSFSKEKRPEAVTNKQGGSLTQALSQPYLGEHPTPADKNKVFPAKNRADSPINGGSVMKNKQSQDKSLPEKEANFELSFKQTALLPDAVDSKRFVLDLIVELSSKKTINIEMQSAFHRGFLKRILLYWARLHSQSLNKGEDYSRAAPTYSLVFTRTPVLSREIKEFVSSFSVKRDKKPFVLLNEDLKIVIVELSKLKKGSFEELIDLQEKWCYFLRESSALKEEERRLLLKDREMSKAMEHLEELSRDKELLYKALSRENSEMAYRLDKQGWIDEGIKEGKEKGMKEGKEKGMKEGKEKGMKEGKEKGMKEGKEKGMKEGMKKGEEKAVRKLALKMLNQGFDKAVISKLTALSEDEIIKLED